MSRRAHAAVVPAVPAARTLADKAAWIERHSKRYAAALHRVADVTIESITAHELRLVQRRKRPA